MILNIISSPTGGGAELLVRELHKIYLRKGLNSHVIYFNGSSSVLGVGEEVLNVNPRSPLNIFRLRKLMKLYRSRNRGDLTVHAHLTWPFLYVALASIGLRRIKLVYTEHSTSNKRRKLPLFRFIERYLYARFSRVICISPGVYKSLAPWVGSRLRGRLVTIPNGSRLYTIGKRQSLDKRKVELVSVGSLTTKKNFTTALRAIGQIKDQISCYTIIGEGPERARLEGLIQEHDLQHVVTLVGWSDSVERYFHAADIQLIPSLWEGFGLVAVEGMSTGISIVASDVDGLREVVGQGNPAVTFVDRVEQAEAWVEGLQIAIKNLRIQASGELILASRQQAEKFNLETMAERYTDVYKNL